MFKSPFLALLGLVFTILGADLAQAEAGRFTMTPTKDGVLRLDTRTGEVALCQNKEARWTCDPVEDNSAKLQSRIDRLERENAELKAQLEAHGGVPGEVKPRPYGKLDMPSDEDVDKAMDFMEHLLHRFKGMMERLQKDDDEGSVPL